MDELHQPYSEWENIPIKTHVKDGKLKVGLFTLLGYLERKAQIQKGIIEEIKNGDNYDEYKSPVG